MRVFITGASGWIGSAVTDEVLGAGHQVTGLARSDASAAALEAKGADVQRGDLDDLASLRAGAAGADAVIHLANKHDFGNQAVSNKAERGAVQALGDALAGSGRTFVIASGMAGRGIGPIGLEVDASPFHGPDAPRGGSENLALDYVAKGVRTVISRFAPTVHGVGDTGFMKVLTEIARDKGFSAYVADGANRWPAVHRSDAARLVRLGLENAEPGAILHAIGQEGVASRTIAEAIGAGLSLPVRSIEAADAVGHFGWIGGFFAMDIPASSAQTQASLGWTPTGPTLEEDLAGRWYFDS
ncbi:MAG: SDR family oxidoreductase [Pseudolysinimonas sp.]|uniref:SDR family oxidoreductase n=1 Tax=Pseudolysinimonas sp. TaxID=2680009 RepID=UPI0032645C8C